MTRTNSERLTREQIEAANPGIKFATLPLSGAYLVGDDGQVWSRWKKTRGSKHRDGFLLSICDSTYYKLKPGFSYGYPGYQIKFDGKIHYRPAHFLVLVSFVGPRPEGMVVCHRDGDSKNPSLGNLRYDTRAANESDKDLHGTKMHGEKNHQAKLTATEVVGIRRASAAGMSDADLGEIYGVTAANIYLIRKRKKWRHVA